MLMMTKNVTTFSLLNMGVSALGAKCCETIISIPYRQMVGQKYVAKAMYIGIAIAA